MNTSKMEAPHLQNISEISTETLTNPDVTPERLAVMRLKDSASLNGGDFASEPGTPTGRRKSFDFSGKLGMSQSSRTRSSRQISTSTRRSGSTMRFNSNKLSMEFSRQAEGKFFALMDLISTASREAASLKESWSGMIREREALAREREELMEQITEVTETLEHKESEQQGHGSELVERKKQVEKLLVDLSNALNTISEYKKKGTERDHELLHHRNELQDLRDKFSRTSITYEKLKSDFETTEQRLRTVEDERDHFKRNGDRHQEELRTLNREHADLRSMFTETTFKLETSRKEALSLIDRFKVSESERDDYQAEKERLQELLRKTNIKKDEISFELSDMTERHEHQQRDINKFKETIRDLESERDKISDTVDHLRREIKTKSLTLDEVETSAAETLLKVEHLKKENFLTREKLSSLELERTEQQEIIEKVREECRLATLEKTQLKDDVEMWRHRSGDGQRLAATLQESIRKSESTLMDMRSEVHTLTDRLSRAERERDEGRNRNDSLSIEITQLKEKLIIVQGEFRAASETRDHLQEELRESKLSYEEVTETMADFRDNSDGYEFEIESLRTMLREAREQKERAITARHEADRERDDYIAKYEEKCRDMEMYEQTAASYFHSQAKSEGKSFSSRIVTRTNTSGTTIHNGHGGESGEYKVSGDTE